MSTLWFYLIFSDDDMDDGESLRCDECQCRISFSCVRPNQKEKPAKRLGNQMLCPKCWMNEMLVFQQRLCLDQ